MKIKEKYIILVERYLIVDKLYKLYCRQERNETWAIYAFSHGKKEIKTIFNAIMRKVDTLNSLYNTDSYVGHRVYVEFFTTQSKCFGGWKE